MTDKETRGKIKWYDAKKAYGFIIAENSNEFFFHVKNVIDLRPDQLTPNLSVYFTVSDLKKKEALLVRHVSNRKVTFSSDALSSILDRNNPSYNRSLLHQLLVGIEQIDDDTSYVLANDILRYGENIGVYNELMDHCFQKANEKYRLKFWLDGKTDICDLNYLATTLFNVDDMLRGKIEKRLAGFSINSNKTFGKVYFESIQTQILEEIAKAKHHIRVAVAWFTHHRQFYALLSKLTENVVVELVIINDCINNWRFGLPFVDFVNAGGKLYLTGPERIMHHKFCIIDDEVLFSGSYNWTYYAEEKNQENCIFFYGEKSLIQNFNGEFNRLIANLEPVGDIFPPPFLPDLFCHRTYQSIDLQYKAKSKSSSQCQEAIELLRESLTMNPENTEAKALMDGFTLSDEIILKVQAVEHTTSWIERQITHVQKQYQQITPATEIIHPDTQPLHQQMVSDLQAQLVVAETLKHQHYQGKRGKLRINLAWNTLDDLDLHVHLPDNQKISYATKQVTCQDFLGELDLDANASGPNTKTPQENIFWESGIPIGAYKVSVVHYRHYELLRVPFAVSIIPEQGEAKVFTAMIEYSSSSKTILEVAELNYSPQKGLVVKSLLPDAVN
jgi:cold shock CspA family protein